MKITREQLRKWNACYTDARVSELIPADGLTPLELAALDIPVEDRMWVLLREEVIPAREMRLLACGWAEGACRAAGWDDQRGKSANKPTICKKEANATPLEFRDELLRLAMKAHNAGIERPMKPQEDGRNE